MSQEIIRLSKAMADVVEERRRQDAEEGHSTTHDDLHDGGELVDNAMECCCAAIAAGHGHRGFPHQAHPSWGLGNKHREDPRRLLVIAAALVLAEIERLDRQAARRREAKS